MTSVARLVSLLLCLLPFAVSQSIAQEEVAHQLDRGDVQQDVHQSDQNAHQQETVASVDGILMHNGYMLAQGQSDGVVYMELQNLSDDEEYTIVAAESPMAQQVQIRSDLTPPYEPFEPNMPYVLLPRGGYAYFNPGGFYFHLIGLHGDLHDGHRIPLTLIFANGARHSLLIPIHGQIGTQGYGSAFRHPGNHFTPFHTKRHRGSIQYFYEPFYRGQQNYYYRRHHR